MIKNLSKDLLQIASSVLENSDLNRKKIYRNLVKETLKQFSVESFSDLSEENQKLFTTIVARKLDEQSCGCEDTETELLHKQAQVNAHSGLTDLGEQESEEIKEDDMPNDEVLYKNGEKKKDLGEEEKAEKDFDKDGEIESPEAEWKGSRDAAIKAAMKEEYASPEPSSAIGHRVEEELPKHADVISDINALTDEKTFRLMVLFPNSRPLMIPSLDLPGAPSLEALGELVAEMNDPHAVIASALAEAKDIPAHRPEYMGNDVAAARLDIAEEKEDEESEEEKEKLNEVSPPDPKIEKWVLANKERFKKEYGAEKGLQVLYAKAWDMYNQK